MHALWKNITRCISNETICDTTGVEKIKKFLRKKRLRWFGHVERMGNERAPVKAKNFVVEDSKNGQPKKRWKKVVEKHMLMRGLIRTDAQDRFLWRFGCKNRLTLLARQTNWVPGGQKDLPALLEQMNDDYDDDEIKKLVCECFVFCMLINLKFITSKFK